MSQTTRVTTKGLARLFISAVATFGLVLSPMTAYAANDMDEFTLPTSNASPTDIVEGPDFNMWFTERDANQIGVASQDGTITDEFTLPTTNAAPTDLTVGPDGALWFIESNVHQIGRISTSGVITEYSLDSSAEPIEIVAASDGNLWFTDTVNNQVSRMTTAGVVTDYPVPTSNAGPHGILAGLDGYLWMTERNASQIARLDLATKVITEYATPTPDAMPTGIATIPNMNDIYFTESAVAQIGYIETNETVYIDEIPMADPTSVPTTIATGFDGGVWFTDLKSNQNKIGRISRERNHEIWEYDLPSSNAQPLGITSRHDDGSTWFTQPGINTLGRINLVAASISSNTELEVQVGVPFEFEVVGVGSPTPLMYVMIGTLPEGLTFTDMGDGTAILAGTPAEGSAGEYVLTFCAETPAEYGVQDFTLTIVE